MTSWRPTRSSPITYGVPLPVRKHATLATLRRDESPRSSGTEVDFAADGNLYLGRMPFSLKALDLRCDPRLALHCRTEDNPAGPPGGLLGDSKMAGTAVGAVSYTHLRAHETDS